METERFYAIDYFKEDHEDDLISSNLVCIVDENAGGIVAYAVDEEYAERIINGLEAS